MNRSRNFAMSIPLPNVSSDDGNLGQRPKPQGQDVTSLLTLDFSIDCSVLDSRDLDSSTIS